MNTSTSSDPNSDPGASEPVDVVIMGGGLAGLTLALQLRQRFVSMSITVLERNTYPVPVAAHKIGESSVEIGAHYFAEVLGLKEHLTKHHLKKFGFRFFFSEGELQLENVTEIGASRELKTPSFQLDRGLFENFLAERALASNINLIQGASVRSFDLQAGNNDAAGAPVHEVHWRRDGVAVVTSARWLIDAAGRSGLIKRKLGLSVPNDHNAHAIWFRIKGHIRIDDWVDAPAWQERCDPRARWLSTNHLVGEGYWVWLIPLSSGNHSVGIVADPNYHPIEKMSSFDKAMDWFKTYQPRLFQELDPRRDDLLDFAYFRRFSYGCKQLFSENRWALTGDAGLFLDPFYSPGSDFIAIANTLIVELIERDFSGERLGAHTQIFNQIFQSFYESTLALYTGQYAIFGDAEVMPRKVLWDYTYYWGILAQLFFQARLSDLKMLSHLRQELAHCQKLNLAVQKFLREWSAISNHANLPVMHDQASVPWFARLNESLRDDLDEDAFKARIRESTGQLTQLARELAAEAQSRYPQLDTTALHAAIAAMPASAIGHETPGVLLASA